MQIDFPYHLDGHRRTASASGDEHVRDMIEQVLFTSPGERVNRPTFGCGLLQMPFAPNRGELASATQLLVQGALQQWLGDVITVADTVVESDDATLSITVTYSLRLDPRVRTATFSFGIGS
jgi:phage baseplate assembly protein W